MSEKDRLRGQFTADQAAAALDQASAAALHLMAATSTVTRRTDRCEEFGSYDLDVQRRFNEYLLRDPDAKFCLHVKTSPQLHWFLVPGCPIGCQPCIAAWLTAYVGIGSDEDSRCDICRSGPHAPGTYTQRILTIGAGPPLTPGGIPPAFTVTYMVCRACEDREPPR